MATFEEILEEAIRLELLVGELYLLFSRQHRQDEPFWWKLALEEENHAALLKTVQKMDAARVPVPTSLLPEKLEVLMESTAAVEKTIEEFEENPDRTRAFQVAYEIETSAGEVHYNDFMTAEGNSHVIKVFRKLNGDDVDHAQRIRAYMENHGIPEKS